MTKQKLPPMMYVFAGNNGSGKSTLRNLLIDKLGIDINIDPDSIARRLDPRSPETKQLAAGKAAVRLIYECIEEEKSFSIETTLAGKNAIHQMIKAKEKGFEITMFYVGLSHVTQNIERVALRVRNGGHHIPTKDILKRDTTSKENLLQHLSLIDNLVVIDNSKSDGELILEISNNQITFETDEIPDWADPIKQKFNTLM